MIEDIHIAIFLVLLLVLFVIKWIFGWGGPYLNAALFLLIAVFIATLFLMQGIYWGLIPLIMAFGAILFYLYDTTWKKDE